MPWLQTGSGIGGDDHARCGAILTIWACPSKNRMTFSFSTGSLLMISFSGRREAPTIRGISACIGSVTGSGICARLFRLSITSTRDGAKFAPDSALEGDGFEP
jgi:hypothetical protein